MGFDAGWKIISASDVGAPHRRQRVWIVAHSNKVQCTSGLNEEFKKEINNKVHEEWKSGSYRLPLEVAGYRFTGIPNLRRVDDGLAAGLDETCARLERTGNGVCSKQSIPAWEEIKRLAGVA